MANDELNRRWEEWCRNTLPQPDPAGFVDESDSECDSECERNNITPYTPSELRARPRFMDAHKKDFKCKGIQEGHQPAH